MVCFSPETAGIYDTTRGITLMKFSIDEYKKKKFYQIEMLINLESLPML